LLTVSKQDSQRGCLLRRFTKKNFITKDLLKTLGDPEEELELISLTKLLLTPGVSSEVRREPPGIPS
jgi:hypothetical protein